MNLRHIFIITVLLFAVIFLFLYLMKSESTVTLKWFDQDDLLSETYTSPSKTFTETKMYPLKRSRYTAKTTQRAESVGIDEVLARRQKGFLDRIPLRDLVHLTKFLNKPKVSCSGSMPEMMILVQSACQHVEHREAIRQTWARKASDFQIPILFFVGLCPNITEEINNHQDVVEVDFVDSYSNNTIKSLARLRWFLEFCAEARFLFMSDDDTVIHFEYLLEYVRSGIGHAMVGPHYKNFAHVFRETDSPWYVPYWTYPYPHYPDYLGGWCYVVNGSVVKDLYEASLDTTFFTVDDVLFTGVAANMAGIVKAGDDRFPLKPSRKFECGENSIICSQDFKPEDIKSVWSEKLQNCFS